MRKPLSIEEIAKASYEVYAQRLMGGLSLGMPGALLPWEQVSIKIQNAWVSAVQEGINLAVADSIAQMESEVK